MTCEKSCLNAEFYCVSVVWSTVRLGGKIAESLKNVQLIALRGLPFKKAESCGCFGWMCLFILSASPTAGFY